MIKVIPYIMLSLMSFASFLNAEGATNEHSIGKRFDTTEKRLETVERLQQYFTTIRNDIENLCHSNSNVMDRYDAFASSLIHVYGKGKGFTETDIYEIGYALLFAAKKHENQTRKDPQATPYIIHPMGVAQQLIEIGKVRDKDIIMAALLHDTVEDTNTTFEEIASQFGIRVEGFVREVTDDKSLPKEERKRRQVVNAGHKSGAAAMIKLSDKLYNLNDLMINPPSSWPKERVDNYFRWAEEVVNSLPWVNSKLKKAVDDMIASYWTSKE